MQYLQNLPTSSFLQQDLMLSFHYFSLFFFQNLLSDELTSAITVKHVITSVIQFLPSYLKSVHGRTGVELFKDVLNIPSSMAYKYWLVKAELSKLISAIPFTTLNYLVPSQSLQDECIDILVLNLEDDDNKVRQEAAEAFVKAEFYWPQDCNLGKCTVTSAAVKMASELLLPIIGQVSVEDDQKSLSRSFYKLQLLLMTSKTPQMTSGIIDTLLNLSESKCTIISLEMLCQCVKILSTRTLVTSDVSSHGKLLKLVANMVRNITEEHSKTGTKFDDITKGILNHD